MRPQTQRARTSPRRRVTMVGAAAAAALLLAACGDGDDGADTDDTSTEDGAEEPSDDAEDAAEGDEEALGDLEDLDLEDPNELVSDGRFAGNGIILPSPEGWSFDEMAFASGIVLATDPEGTQQIAGEAVDPEDLPEPLSFDDVLDANRETVEQDAEVDEEVELTGAARAQQLRYLDVPGREEGAPDTSVVLLIAEREDGILGVFNYAAASDDFDDAVADELLATAGFDPDSDPAEPPTPTPSP
ncbi:MAG: hypothetical protein WD638_13640 [Nitriliruptoraceae bacterium]